MKKRATTAATITATITETIRARFRRKTPAFSPADMAAEVEALRSLVEGGFKPRKDIILAATSDEETGSHAAFKFAELVRSADE